MTSLTSTGWVMLTKNLAPMFHVPCNVTLLDKQTERSHEFCFAEMARKLPNIEDEKITHALLKLSRRETSLWRENVTLLCRQGQQRSNACCGNKQGSGKCFEKVQKHFVLPNCKIFSVSFVALM